MAAPKSYELLMALHTRKAYTGGGATALDALVVTADHIGMIAFVCNSGNVTVHQLEAGPDAESSPNVVRPDNFALTTNEVVWKQKTFA